MKKIFIVTVAMAAQLSANAFEQTSATVVFDQAPTSSYNKGVCKAIMGCYERSKDRCNCLSENQEYCRQLITYFNSLDSQGKRDFEKDNRGFDSIPGRTYKGMRNVKRLEIPGTIETLGVACFCSCLDLEEIVINEGTKTLGDFCFSGCWDLAKISIPDSVTTLGRSCFSGCCRLESAVIPNRVQTLESYCFWFCTDLESVRIGNKVQTLGDSCFSLCSSLTRIDVPNGVQTIGNYCFWGCSSLAKIGIPTSVQAIGKNCFRECSSLWQTVGGVFWKYNF
jgi:hypothetical protein